MASAEALTDALSSLTAKLRDLISDAEKLSKESMEKYLTEGVFSLGASIGHYARLFTSLQVKDRQEMESLVQANFRNLEVQEEFDDLLEAEGEWNRFLEGVETYLEQKDKVTSLKVNDPAPMDLPLIECISELDGLKCRVLVVACGPRSGALQTVKEMNLPYPLLLDRERKLYHLFGMRRSVSKVWNSETMIYYGEQAASRKLHKPVEGDDQHQMGGDLIINSDHKMALVYCSKLPPDRPSYEKLAETLKRIVPEEK